MTEHPALPVEIKWLEQINLFKDLPSADLQAICQTARRVMVKRGDLFFHQDDPAIMLYVLIDGQVKMTQTGPDGHQVIVRMIVPGKDFGAITALMDTFYPLSAQAAVTDSVALAWATTRVRPYDLQIELKGLQIFIWPLAQNKRGLQSDGVQELFYTRSGTVPVGRHRE